VPAPRNSFDLPAVISIVAALVGTVLLLYPAFGLTTQESRAAGLALLTIGLLAAGRVPGYFTALLLFLVAMLFAVAPTNVVFSGFASTALWLVFGGLVFGVAITATGLGKRVAAHIAVHLGGSYVRLIVGLTVPGWRSRS